MKNLTTTSTDLFHKIRSTFTDIKIGDQEGKITNDPSAARFFDLNYSVQGNDLGRVNIKIDDDSLTVIYNDAMFDQSEISKDNWFDFLKDLRQFAKRNMLRFDTRDIMKSNLEKRDYQYLAQSNGENKMSESKLFGTSKTSYQDIGDAKLIVKHSAPINYDNPAGRTHRIESIYIESSGGERFRYPHKHLNGARAMAMHINHGGTVYDQIGGYISSLSEELGKLKQFKNYANRSGVMAEALGDLTQRVLDRMDSIRYEINDLQKHIGYEKFSTSFQPQKPMEVPDDVKNGWVDALTIKSFNEELTDVFPYLYRLVNEQPRELSYADIVAEETGVCEDCEKDPCECDSDVKEDSRFAEFEQQMDDITTFDYDLDEAPGNAPPQQKDRDLPFEPDETPVSDKDEYGNTIKHRAQHLARKGMKSVMPKEVVEFIASLYDRETKTFPRGEEGVKIAVEKRFGEQAGQFANYVVEKLSGTHLAQSATKEAGGYSANNHPQSKDYGTGNRDDEDDDNLDEILPALAAAARVGARVGASALANGVEEGRMSEVDLELRNIAASGDEEQLIDAMGGLMGGVVADTLEYMRDELADELAAKGMNNVINDEDKMIELLMDKLVAEYGDDDIEDEDEEVFNGAKHESTDEIARVKQLSGIALGMKY